MTDAQKRTALAEASCDRCFFWAPRGGYGLEGYGLGRCRRLPPSSPACETRRDDWCGEWLKDGPRE